MQRREEEIGPLSQPMAESLRSKGLTRPEYADKPARRGGVPNSCKEKGPVFTEG
jgi:hypothetical protein